MKIATTLLLFLITLSTFSDTLHVDPQTVIAEKKAFINKLVTKQHFNRAKLTALLNTLHRDPAVIASMTQPFEKRPWGYYRDYFVTEERVRLGAAYLKTHHHELVAMQKKYGIPPSVITAIIGVETEYGLHLGKYSVLNALYTLGFYYPPRAKFFRSELAEYLILTRDNQLPPKKLKGSYAGAFGIPQFMPSSYRYYGVSANQKPTVNLYHHDDAIVSIANYFHKMGWQANQPIAKRLLWKHSPRPVGTGRIMLHYATGKQYWATYPNFAVVMRYNHNIVYVMAVYQLSKAIEARYLDTGVNG